MDFVGAVESHLDWKIRFRVAIETGETLCAQTVYADDCCDLGKWLQGGVSSKGEGSQAYRQCLEAHSAFHQEAGKVADAINVKDMETARALTALGSAYDQISRKTTQAIMRLSHAL